MANDGIKITAPVSMTDIATVIGDSTDMAQSENINGWSKNKPFEPHENFYEVQDDAARRKAAYGFYWWNVSQEEEAPFALAAAYVFDKAIDANGEWKWKKPVTTDRMSDFDGYDHSAILPYRYTDKTAGGDSDHWKILELEMLPVAESNVVAESMPSVFGTEIMDYMVKFIYSRMENGERVEVKVIDVGCFVGDLSAANKITAEFKVPPTVQGEPHYYSYVWAATNKDELAADRAWFYFPNGVGEFVYDGFYQVRYAYDTDYLPSPFEAINVNGYVVTSAEHEVKSLKLVLEAYHNFNYPAEGKLILHVWGREQGWDSGKDYEIEAMDDGATLFDINIEDAISGYVRADDTLMALSVYVRDEREEIITSPNYTSYHFDFENNTLASDPAGESDSISIWRMMEIRNDFR